MGKRLCIQCRWLDIRVDFDRGSNYRCVKTGELITGGILERPACENFAFLPADYR